MSMTRARASTAKARKSSTASARQLSLVPTWQKERFAFGGSLLRNSHAKSKRPFSRKLAVHVVLRSSEADGAKSMLRQARSVDAILFDEASRRSVRLHGAANAGNHLHLLVQAPSREHLNAFLRSVSGRIAMLVTGARKGSPRRQRGTRGSDGLSDKQLSARKGHAPKHGPVRKNPGFWDQRPFTRLVSLGRDLTSTLAYISLNSTESAGFSRSSARAMFREIRERLARGEIMRSPGLLAAGFT